MSLPVFAQDENYLLSRTASSGAQIIGASLLPSTDVFADLKFGLYFASGLENPCLIMPVVGAVGVFKADPVAVSTAFSLANRCMALTGLHDALGFEQGLSYALVMGADFALGQIPRLEKFAQTKWMAALGNALEYSVGRLPAGAILM